jgi:RNA recognition motif-containing protein
MLRRDEKATEVAVIEFETKEDALAAVTRDQKKFEAGDVISVSMGAETTLWITNIPPMADEEYFRNLFSKVGATVDVLVELYTNPLIVR